MRAALLIPVALAACARPAPDPLAGKPLAAWRSVPNLPVRRLVVMNAHGRAVLVPNVEGMLCTDASDGNNRALCGIWLHGRTGRPVSEGLSVEPEGVDATFYFTPEDPLAYRRDTRTDPDQLAGHGGDLAEEPVLDAVRGTVAGRRMAAGCWREAFDELNAPVYCQLWIEVPGEGVISARYWGRETGPGAYKLDRTRLRRIVQMLIATEHSFKRV